MQSAHESQNRGAIGQPAKTAAEAGCAENPETMRPSEKAGASRKNARLRTQDRYAWREIRLPPTDQFRTQAQRRDLNDGDQTWAIAQLRRREFAIRQRARRGRRSCRRIQPAQLRPGSTGSVQQR